MSISLTTIERVVISTKNYEFFWKDKATMHPLDLSGDGKGIVVGAAAVLSAQWLSGYEGYVETISTAGGR